MTDKRVRLVATVVQLELVADDGERLEPLEMQPVRFPAAAWPPDLDAIITQVQKQVDEQSGAEPSP